MTRTTYTVVDTADIEALIALADAMADSLIGSDYDRAKAGIDRAREALIDTNNESPFLRHRQTILGNYSTALRLQELVLHLWNDTFKVRLASLFGGADTEHTRIALELITSYTRHGERDPDFMRLSDEIKDTAC